METEVIKARADIVLEGLVIADPFGGRFEDRVAVYPAKRWAEIACNPASVWRVARGDDLDGSFTAHDGCTWVIRRLTPAIP